MGEKAEREDDISAFDAANYAYQMTAELARMAREGALSELAETLDKANAQAAQAMIDLRHKS